MIELEMQDRMELVREAQDVVKSWYLLCILVAQRIHQLENGIDKGKILYQKEILFENNDKLLHSSAITFQSNSLSTLNTIRSS